MPEETTYRSLYVQGRGEFRRELAGALRGGRAQRRSDDNAGGTAEATAAGSLVISERPAGAADRAVPGHWESDLLVGRDGKSHLATLVERWTRYVLLAKIPNAGAETVAAALAQVIVRLPAHVLQSLLGDERVEPAGPELFAVPAGVAVYFCDPASPWRGGSNESTNGLLRQYFPKDISLRGYSQEDLDRVAFSLNGRPRQTLDWHTPAEVLLPLLVAGTNPGRPPDEDPGGWPTGAQRRSMPGWRRRA